MSDEEHHFESKADASDSKTYPQQASTIHKNDYIVIKGRPLSLLTKNGNTKDDLKLPTDESLLTQAICKDFDQKFRATIATHRAAHDLLKSKCQEIDSVQSIINILNNVIFVGDIDGKIRSMEHMIEHETLPLNKEKQLIREIKQLKQNCEELSSNMKKQDQSQQSVDNKDDNIEEHFKATGEDYFVEPAESRRPFRALLDVGLIKTTIGNRVFGALKGALDGGLDIPHNDKRFAGFDKELDVEGIEALYKKVHAAIRVDPTLKKSDKQPPKEHKRVSASFCKYNLKKLTYEDRKAKFISRVAALNSRCCR
ncbi:60S ribosomal protein L5-1 [Glycine soja]|uniref:60S ribosomal protein L5-1 n=1 Tax=Glycine soja TaxID=3848 RepID=A0A0B2PZ45_GLYSO|nr:60S ribosomal protein L5-1 [Glycine soja]